MNKEIRIGLDDVILKVRKNIDVKYNLPVDKCSIQDRNNFIEQVYYTYLREVKCNNTLDLTYINSALTGNLASWFANTLSYGQKAPYNYRCDVIKFVEDIFKGLYVLENSIRKYKILDNDKIVDETYLRKLLFEYELNDIWDNKDEYFDTTYNLQSQFHMLELAQKGEFNRVLYYLSTNWGVDAEEVENNDKNI